MLGDVLDEHQAQCRCAVGRNLPLGFAQFTFDPHVQRAFPAFTDAQSQAQLIENGVLLVCEGFAQGVRVAVILDQPGERMVALMHLELRIEHGNRRGNVGEDLPKTRLAFAQCVFGVAHAQQRAQGGQQHIRVDGVNQVGIGTGVQAGDDVAGLDRGCGYVDNREQGGGRFRAQFAHDVEATHVRQVDVEDQRVEGFAVDQGQAFTAGSGFEHDVAMSLQAPAQGVPGGDVVVDYQQTHVTFHRRTPWRGPAV
ncbi:hypothetical protein D3C73_1003090 [compost metagenome]